MDHETWGSQKAYFQAYIIHYHGPMDLTMGEAKEVHSLQMSGGMAKNVVLILIYFLFLKFIFQTFFIVMRKDGKKKRRRSNLKGISKTTLFDIYLKKKSTHPLYDAHGHFSWSTLGLHLVRGPKALEMHLKKNRTFKMLPWNVTMETCPLTWDNLMVHDVNKPSIWWCAFVDTMAEALFEEIIYSIDIG